jgi:dTDP-4-amino-4,6-dideoxygalactose transaminase
LSLPPAAAPLAAGDLAAALHAPKAAPEAFAAALARYLGVPACRVAASGRVALFLLLKALSARAGDTRREVLMPAYTCPALARVALDLGLQPRLVDVIPETLEMAPDGLRAAAGSRTLAIIHVHPFGIPLDLTAAQEAARGAGAALIEDAAQAFGARQPRPPGRAGAAGDFGLFSLGPGKPLSTGGGGAVCARDPSGADLLREAWAELRPGASLPAVARLALLDAVFRPQGWRLATRLGALRFGESEAGLSYTVEGLSAAQAAIGLRALPRLDAANEARRVTAASLAVALGGLDGLHMPRPDPATGAIYLRFPLLMRDEARRDGSHAALSRAGLGAGRMYRRTLAETFPELSGSYPGAESLARRLLTLPTHAFVGPAHIARMAEILSSL